MRSNIKHIIEQQETNPHIISKETGLTYRVVLALNSAPYIKPTTPIGTLQKIADALNVSVVDLYELENETA